LFVNGLLLFFTLAGKKEMWAYFSFLIDFHFGQRKVIRKPMRNWVGEGQRRRCKT
jgi:hypothetical protein